MCQNENKENHISTLHFIKQYFSCSKLKINLGNRNKNDLGISI